VCVSTIFVTLEVCSKAKCLSAAVIGTFETVIVRPINMLAMINQRERPQGRTLFHTLVHASSYQHRDIASMQKKIG
jgi:hypothetical protein